MRLRHLDLNLLIALDALLALRSVTAAAKRLHVTQPSMSGSLARLREHFADPLLVRVGRSMDLSPLGDSLRTPILEVLQKIDAAVSVRPSFDAATSVRHFSISASEATVLALLAEVMRVVERRAPGVTVEIQPIEPTRIEELLDRRELDFAFVGENHRLSNQPSALMMSEELVCIAWTGNKRVRRELTMAQYLALPHAITRYGTNRRPGFEQFMLDRLGIQRRMAVSCTTPTLLGPLVAGTQRLATLSDRLARQQAAVLPLKILRPPMPLPPLEVHLQWHRAREHDGALRWFRALAADAARLLRSTG